MIGKRLQEPINWMESHSGIRSRHDPFMMRLVQVLIYARMMQATMNEVYAEVGEEQEERELSEVVPPPGSLSSGVVEFGITTHFEEEERGGEEGDEWHCRYSLVDFLSDLVFEELGVFERGLVEDEDVGES